MLEKYRPDICSLTVLVTITSCIYCSLNTFAVQCMPLSAICSSQLTQGGEEDEETAVEKTSRKVLSAHNRSAWHPLQRVVALPLNYLHLCS